MDLIELRRLRSQLDEADRRLRYWLRPCVAPERAGAIKTVERRRRRLRDLRTERDRLRQVLAGSFGT